MAHVDRFVLEPGVGCQADLVPGPGCCEGSLRLAGNALPEAAEDNAEGKVDEELFEDWPDTPIEEALPESLEAEHHLSVVDENGDLQG